MGKYDQARLRLHHSLDDLVSEARKLAPKLDKPLLSKAFNDGYGIELKPELVKALAQAYDPEGWGKRRNRDRHALRASVRCRMTDEEFAAFTAAWKSAGYKSANDCVLDLILKYTEERKMIRDLLEEERLEREKNYWNSLDKEDSPE